MLKYIFLALIIEKSIQSDLYEGEDENWSMFDEKCAGNAPNKEDCFSRIPQSNIGFECCFFVETNRESCVSIKNELGKEQFLNFRELLNPNNPVKTKLYCKSDPVLPEEENKEEVIEPEDTNVIEPEDTNDDLILEKDDDITTVDDNGLFINVQIQIILIFLVLYYL